TASSNTRTVTVSQGVTVNLLGAGSADLTVTRSSTALSSALASFADSYNAVVAELSKQHGQSAGALQGQSIVSALSQSLSGLATYTSDTGGVANLHDLGLDLGSDGKLAFNQLKFLSA